MAKKRKYKNSDNMAFITTPFTVFPHKIFLLDGLGALLSAVCLGIVLPGFPDIFGAPQGTLYLLAGVACLFAAYSLTCYFAAPVKWRPYLAVIATANTLYSLFTIRLVFWAGQDLPLPGAIYFVLELIVLAGLIFLEWRVLLNTNVVK